MGQNIGLCCCCSQYIYNYTLNRFMWKNYINRRVYRQILNIYLKYHRYYILLHSLNHNLYHLLNRQHRQYYHTLMIKKIYNYKINNYRYAILLFYIIQYGHILDFGVIIHNIQDCIYNYLIDFWQNEYKYLNKYLYLKHNSYI